MSGWNVEQRKFLINIDYCLLGNLVCLGDYIISPENYNIIEKKLKMLILAFLWQTVQFLPTNYNFFHVLAPNGKGGVFWTRAELAE